MELQVYQKKTPDIMEEIFTRKDLSPYWCTNSIQGNLSLVAMEDFEGGRGVMCPRQIEARTKRNGKKQKSHKKKYENL